MTLYCSYAVRSSTICANLCTNMPWNTSKRLVQQKNGSFLFLPTANAWLLSTSLKACDLVGRHFRRQHQSYSRSFTEKMALSPCCTYHPGQHETDYVTFEFLLHAAFGADEIRGFTLEPPRSDWLRGRAGLTKTLYPLHPVVLGRLVFLQQP